MFLTGLLASVSMCTPKFHTSREWPSPDSLANCRATLKGTLSLCQVEVDHVKGRELDEGERLFGCPE